MKALLFTCALLSGCLPLAAHENETLKPQATADTIKVQTSYGGNLPITEIKEANQVTHVVSFINALPNQWSVPWYGPPVGKVYFKFYRGKEFVGNFYVGPNFFGRDGRGFWSQPASPAQIQELGKIIGFDLWAYVNEKRP